MLHQFGTPPRSGRPMPSLELLIPFFLAAAVFACVPGPGMFYAAAQTIARGRRAGWLSAVGFHLGGYVHISAAAFGLAIVLETRSEEDTSELTSIMRISYAVSC